jgi:hypothetical protein
LSRQNLVTKMVQTTCCSQCCIFLQISENSRNSINKRSLMAMIVW